MMVCIEEEIIMEYMTMPATQEILQLPENTFLPVMSELTTARMCVSQAFWTRHIDVNMVAKNAINHHEQTSELTWMTTSIDIE